MGGEFRFNLVIYERIVAVSNYFGILFCCRIILEADPNAVCQR